MTVTHPSRRVVERGPTNEHGAPEWIVAADGTRSDFVRMTRGPRVDLDRLHPAESVIAPGAIYRQTRSPTMNTPATPTPLPLDEFTRRFVEALIDCSGSRDTDLEGENRDYGVSAAAYWTEQHQEGESPEDCARADWEAWDG